MIIKGSSSITRLEAYVSFKVKYCHKVFDYVEFKKRCEEIFYKVAEKQDLIIEEMGFDRNHVHMTWLMRVYHRVDQLSKALKGTSGRKLLKEFPEIKKKYFWGSGLWSGVIYADSIGKDPIMMNNYVKNQGVSLKYQKTLKNFIVMN